MKQYSKKARGGQICLSHQMSLRSISYLITNSHFGNPVLELMQLLKRRLRHPQSTKEEKISIPLLACTTRSVTRPPYFLLHLCTGSRTPCELV